MVLATWYMEKEGMKEAGMQRETGGGRGGRGGGGGGGGWRVVGLQ